MWGKLTCFALDKIELQRDLKPWESVNTESHRQWLWLIYLEQLTAVIKFLTIYSGSLLNNKMCIKVFNLQSNSILGRLHIIKF